MTDSALQPILCLLGHPAAGSPMQLAMERAFISANLDWRYLTLDVESERLAAALAGIGALGFRGANLTGALTKSASMLLNQVLGSAKVAQWVDCITVQRQDRVLIGENQWGRVVGQLAGTVPETDSIAFLAGDAPSMLAVAAELATMGWSKVIVEALDVESAARMNLEFTRPVIEPRRVGKRFPSGIKLLVHGLDDNGDENAFDLQSLDRLTDLTRIIDLTRPQEASPLTRAAKDREITCMSGLDVMVQYTAQCFEHWTGLPGNHDILRETFEEYYEI